MLKQLDVKLLLQRFNYLERVAEYVVRSNLLSEGKFYGKETLGELKKRRRRPCNRGSSAAAVSLQEEYSSGGGGLLLQHTHVQHSSSP